MWFAAGVTTLVLVISINITFAEKRKMSKKQFKIAESFISMLFLLVLSFYFFVYDSYMKLTVTQLYIVINNTNKAQELNAN
jgi:hypothetical protein